MLPLLVLLLALSPHQARRLPLGSEITLEGFVTVPSGAFQSFMDDNGFVLGDATTGIYVATNDKGYRSLASAVEVTGTLADNGHGLLVLKARSIRPQKGSRLIQPWTLESNSLSELHEGKLLKATGVVLRLTNDLPYGYKLFLTLPKGGEIQVFLPPAARPTDDLLTPGRRIEVIGFCAQYNQVYEIVPRSANDFH
jgi:hypothetical protein